MAFRKGEGLTGWRLFAPPECRFAPPDRRPATGGSRDTLPPPPRRLRDRPFLCGSCQRARRVKMAEKDSAARGSSFAHGLAPSSESGSEART